MLLLTHKYTVKLKEAIPVNHTHTHAIFCSLSLTHSDIYIYMYTHTHMLSLSLTKYHSQMHNLPVSHADIIYTNTACTHNSKQKTPLNSNEAATVLVLNTFI